MNNYEEYMILFADGELNAAEQQELLAFVKAHPELEAEMKAYASTKLVQDTTISFGNKESLLQIPIKSKVKSQKSKAVVISWQQWVAYGAAAGVAALLITLLVKWNGTTTHTEIARIDTVKHQVPPIPAPVIAQQELTKEKTENKNLKKVVTKIPEARYTNNKAIQQVIAPEQKPEEQKETTIAKLDIEPTKKLDNEIIQPETIKTVTVQEVATTDTKTKKGLLDKLPIDDEKKEGIDNMRNSLVNSFKQAKHITNNLKETALVVKVGGKKIQLNL